MTIQQVVSSCFLAATAVVTTACATGDDNDFDELEVAKLVAVNPPSGTLQASVVQIASSDALLAAVTSHDNVYLHAQADGAWYYKSANYLLGIESFTQYHRELDFFTDLGSGGNVAPLVTRIVGENPDGRGWTITASSASWPGRANSVWVIGTNDGVFDMGGAPQGIPMGSEVFGSMQTYGGIPSTPWLEGDDSPGHDSTRIRAAFPFNASTLLGGHSAGSSAARRIARDIGNSHTWLYGTPNYSRGNGAFSRTETVSGHTMVAEIINNPSDPVTNSLSNPFTLVSLAWGTAKCHDYSHWDYQKTAANSLVCN